MVSWIKKPSGNKSCPLSHFGRDFLLEIIMLIKYCDRCRRQLRIGEKCPYCFKARNKSYAKDDFYQSSEWLKARKLCIELCCGLDLYSLYHNDTIEYGYTVHHIEPVEVSPQLRLEQSNLIYLSESSHQIVHNLYKQGKYLETVKFLKSIKEKFMQGAVWKTFFLKNLSTRHGHHFAKF